MKVDIQLSPAVEPWHALRDGVRRAEDAGFAAAWVFDHFAGSMIGGTSMLECFTLLGALAGSTEQIELGSLVVNVANRNPGVLAMCAASVQHISGGRFLLGVGAGASPATRWGAEHADLGLELGPTIAARHARFVEALDEIDRVWGDPQSEIAATYPRPVPRPPIIVGLNSAPLARIAGERCDGINVRADHPDLELLLDTALDAREAAGRGAAPWVSTIWTHFDEALGDPDHPQRRQWERRGIDRLVLTCLRPHDPAAMARTRPRRA